MNSADKLFEQVMSDIGKNGLSDRPDWPDIIPRDDVPTDEFDRFPTDDEIIRPIGDQFDIDRAIERLTGIAPDAVITDGPYAEVKEIVGGYLLVKTDTLDDAVELSKGCPGLLDGGTVEVRDVMVFDF